MRCLVGCHGTPRSRARGRAPGQWALGFDSSLSEGSQRISTGRGRSISRICAPGDEGNLSGGGLRASETIVRLQQTTTRWGFLPEPPTASSSQAR
ncbi:hypothetical protein FM105_02050 [Brevibacterium yomogidense]|uniref:Uncharacterized protein n=1 Tax=Brevibacterium yomogidense TaxID=946573 RepID=A0A1X6WZD8_9MICO|nr:hypothetical protein FM105_02050 [Brevibacterium yomogidense]